MTFSLELLWPWSNTLGLSQTIDMEDFITEVFVSVPGATCMAEGVTVLSGK